MGAQRRGRKEVTESQILMPSLRGLGGGDETEGRAVFHVSRINPFQLLTKGETSHLYPEHRKPARSAPFLMQPQLR